MEKEYNNYIKDNHKVYDRFTFDSLFRYLLKDEYKYEEAKNFIINNCALSALVLQERIYNNYYLKISVDDEISYDLLELKNEAYNKKLENKICELL